MGGPGLRTEVRGGEGGELVGRAVVVGEGGVRQGEGAGEERLRCLILLGGTHAALHFTSRNKT